MPLVLSHCALWQVRHASIFLLHAYPVPRNALPLSSAQWRPHLFCDFTMLLLGRKSKLRTSNKLLIYKAIFKPIWTYGIQLWGTASISNIEILERFQSKALRMIVDAPWYMQNAVIRRDLQTSTAREEIRRYSSQYSARPSAHPNGLVVNFVELPDNRRMQKHLPNDLPTRFLV
jgi:hypothetical protein